MNTFEVAARKKLRFDTNKGLLAVEDLWDLPLTSATGKANLNDIAVGLYKQLRNSDDVSFVDTAKKSDETVQLKFDIVKHVIDTRVAERDAAAQAAKKQAILAIVEQKQTEALHGQSVEELLKLANSLQ